MEDQHAARDSPTATVSARAEYLLPTFTEVRSSRLVGDRTPDRLSSMRRPPGLAAPAVVEARLGLDAVRPDRSRCHSPGPHLLLIPIAPDPSALHCGGRHLSLIAITPAAGVQSVL